MCNAKLILIVALAQVCTGCDREWVCVFCPAMHNIVQHTRHVHALPLTLCIHMLHLKELKEGGGWSISNDHCKSD